jgi:peptidoglycan hydrolase-like protein with peptidoglycan-binding domain
MSACALPLARHWLLTLIVSILAVFAASYFCFTAVHALESFDTESCTPLALGSSGKCVSSLRALLNRNQPYPAIAVDGYFGPQAKQAAIGFQSAHHLAAVDGVVAGETAGAINKFSPWPMRAGYGS